MDRKTLESAADQYPYMHLQGLYGVPGGLLWFLIGLSNLQEQPVKPWILGVGLLLGLAALSGVGWFYQTRYGKVVPTRARKIRYGAAFAGSFLAFVGVDQIIRMLLGRPPAQPIASYCVAWAVGMFVFYAATAGIKMHHVIIWGGLLVAGILPIWGLGVDRDAIASFPIGLATIASGILDHLQLVRRFGPINNLDLENNSAGA